MIESHVKTEEKFLKGHQNKIKKQLVLTLRQNEPSEFRVIPTSVLDLRHTIYYINKPD